MAAANVELPLQLDLIVSIAPLRTKTTIVI